MNCFKGEGRRKSKKAESAPELRNPSVSPKRQANSASSSKSIPELYMERHQNLRVFNLEELKQATNNFNKMLKIGQGGFGSVYKGRIRPVVGGNPAVAVAVKRLNKNGWQGEKEWVAEVQFLGVVDHPNLVRLMGYCSEEGERGIQRLLVYEYMRHRSLDDHLFDDSHTVQKPLHLPWKIRLHIMLGAAQGLAYLHQGPLQVQVIFRDFKSSNVLLDDNMNAKLSDFGLARQGPTGERTHVSTAPVGTLGYTAPEYVDTGHLNLKSDIYSYGVVLYEILTGCRVLDRNRPTPEQKLLEWVRHFPPDSSRFHDIMDARLRNNYSRPAAIKIANLAGRCVSKSPSHRPHMNEIVDVLLEAIAYRTCNNQTQ